MIIMLQADWLSLSAYFKAAWLRIFYKTGSNYHVWCKYVIQTANTQTHIIPALQCPSALFNILVSSRSLISLCSLKCTLITYSYSQLTLNNIVACCYFQSKVLINSLHTTCAGSVRWLEAYFNKIVPNTVGRFFLKSQSRSKQTWTESQYWTHIHKVTRNMTPK